MHHLASKVFAALFLIISSVAHSDPGERDAPVIAHLAFRDRIVTIASSPQGYRYSVREKSGALLGEDLSDAQLLAAHPELHALIHSAVADDASAGFIWAGRDERMVEPALDAMANPGE